MLHGTIVGRVGQNPRFIETNGTTLASFSVASTRRWTDNQGTQHDTTTWVNVTVSNGQVNAAKYLRKGDQVACTGQMELNNYTARDGQQRTSLEMRFAQIGLLANPRDKDGELIRGTYVNGNDAHAADAVPEPPAAPADDEIPF